jgi:1,4-alpha-glucan branching enzyme
MIAEESTAWPMITKPTDIGGLGFNFKWNMGWMNDILSYVKTDPLYRNHHHNQLTFSMMYAFSENFVLPISHDEVVHGKGSLIGKMPGSYEDKFAGVRAFLGYMFSHPGKKLNFMGSEFGQFKEWAYKEGVEYFLKDEYPMHKKLFDFVKELNGIYLAFPALYEIENSWNGFEWLEANDADANFIAYQRIDKSGNKILSVINFSGRDHFGYRLGVEPGKYQLILNSDSTRFGGSGRIKKRTLTAERKYSHNKEYSVSIDIPKLTCLYFIKTI